MADAKTLVREWLDLAAVGPAEAWPDRVARDVVVRLPYAPPGVEPVMNGYDEALAVLGSHWHTKTSFNWRDVVILATEDPELFVTTARSEVMMVTGKPYANTYIMLTRVRDGLIVEHAEYFNPLPILEMLNG
jgi:ketosteroid isomerase-like protein